MIAELKRYGAWEYDELSNMTNDELEMKLIWIAACDLKEMEDLK